LKKVCVVLGLLLSGALPARSQSAVSSDPVLVGAGDIANCKDLSGAETTAKLLDNIPGVVFTLGDHAYPDGTASQFTDCYAPTWGRHKARTRPSIGNHDYHTPHAAGYFAYWGNAAGDPQKGYYSYELGAWHVVVINSNCQEVGGCDAGSPQERWLRSDLQAHPATCTLAYWHHPMFSSGAKPQHARHLELKPLWQALYDANADLVLNGHEHNYERFAPQDPDGKPDTARGVREIVVGVGGKDFDPLTLPQPNSEVRGDGVLGVLKLTLHAKSYDWDFVPAPGAPFSDHGTATCHVPITVKGGVVAGSQHP
jgi:predicted phosphohydrolase